MPEEQYIAISVLDFKSPQTITVILEWLKKLDIARRELRRQCIRIRDITVSVPPGNALVHISRVVRHWSNTDGLQQDHRRTPADDAGEDVIVTGPLNHDVEPETVAIKRQRRWDIL